jgi:hypothetical protein
MGMGGGISGREGGGGRERETHTPAKSKDLLRGEEGVEGESKGGGRERERDPPRARISSRASSSTREKTPCNGKKEWGGGRMARAERAREKLRENRILVTLS